MLSHSWELMKSQTITFTPRKSDKTLLEESLSNKESITKLIFLPSIQRMLLSQEHHQLKIPSMLKDHLRPEKLLQEIQKLDQVSFVSTQNHQMKTRRVVLEEMVQELDHHQVPKAQPMPNQLKAITLLLDQDHLISLVKFQKNLNQLELDSYELEEHDEK